MSDLIGLKITEGKAPLDILDWEVLELAAKCFEEMKKQYPLTNHLLPLDGGKLAGAAMRHLSKKLQGEDISDHGYPHSIHVLLNAMILAGQELRGTEIKNELITYLKSLKSLE